MKPNLYLFDLDGTLADSAPDLCASANYVRAEEGLPPLPFETLRPAASGGARALLGAALGIKTDDERYKELEAVFLNHYELHLGDRPKLFDGISEVLREIDARGAKWGIVTNKFRRFTAPLLAALNLQPATLVCGDTLNRRKPFPDPILHAMWELDASGAETVYVGDDLRDIQAAHAAGVPGLAASWGYLGSSLPIQDWRADKILCCPSELLDYEYSCS